MCWHSPSDRKFAVDLRTEASSMFSAYTALNEAVFESDEAVLPRKTKELIALGVAFTTQCPFCIDTHAKAAHHAGATRAEVAESAMVAAALRAGGAVTHGFQAMKTMRELDGAPRGQQVPEH